MVGRVPVYRVLWGSVPPGCQQEAGSQAEGDHVRGPGAGAGGEPLAPSTVVLPVHRIGQGGVAQPSREGRGASIPALAQLCGCFTEGPAAGTGPASGARWPERPTRASTQPAAPT